MVYVKENCYTGTGTGHENQVPKGCCILLCCAGKKLQRGYYEYRSCDDGILITRWHYHSTIYSIGVAKIENKTMVLHLSLIKGRCFNIMREFSRTICHTRPLGMHNCAA
jgi:hypothetical protein